MSYCNLTNIILSCTNLLETDLYNIKSENIFFDLILPNNYKIIGGYLFGPDVNLSNSIFNNLNLEDIILENANFKGCVFYKYDRFKFILC